MSGEQTCKICNCIAALGLFLTGAAACYALYQGDGLLDRIIEIQNKAVGIKDSIGDMKTVVSDIKSSVREMEKTLSNKRISDANEIIRSKQDPNRIFAHEIIPLGDPKKGIVVNTMGVLTKGEVPEYKGNLRSGQVFLPTERFEPVSRVLFNEKTSESDKIKTLENAVEIKE